MKNKGTILKKQIGQELGYLRLKRHKTLQQVAQDSNIPWKIIDKIEIGENANLNFYMQLLKYYHYKIGIISE